MNQGFILLHRQLLDWEWYDHLPTKVLFIHCLLRANHSKGSWRGQSYERGEFITSIHGLAVETGLSVKQVRTALDNLTESKELGKRSTSLNTVISVLNYDFYQSVGKPNGTQKASKGQTRGKRGANEGQQINNENNVNNENNETNQIPAWEEFLAYALEKKQKASKQDLKLKYESWIESGWKVNRGGKLQPIQNWKTTLLNTLPYIKEGSPTGHPVFKIAL
jgi:hypothetical protein